MSHDHIQVLIDIELMRIAALYRAQHCPQGTASSPKDSSIADDLKHFPSSQQHCSATNDTATSSPSCGLAPSTGNASTGTEIVGGI